MIASWRVMTAIGSTRVPDVEDPRARRAVPQQP
jgi:hypothetical protein